LGQIKSLSEYGLMIADTVVVKSSDSGADLLTKMGKNPTDISYTINEDNDDDDDDDDESEESDDGDRKLAKKIAKEEEAKPSGGRRSNRLAANAVSAEINEGAAERERKQIELMSRKNEERLRELARLSKKKGGDDKTRKAEELETYKSTKNLPDNVLPNQVKVDMARQCVILPICGNPVPFHISTIKNVVLPDPDTAAYLRINFYTAGMAVGKDCPQNTLKLVQKYAPYATFIREMTFRSLDSQSLTTVSALHWGTGFRCRRQQLQLRRPSARSLSSVRVPGNKNFRFKRRQTW